MRHTLVLAALLCLAGCSGASGPGDAVLAEEVRRCIVQPRVAAYLIDGRYASAEAIVAGPPLEVRELFRRTTGDPDRIQVRVLIQGELQVTMPPVADLGPLQRLPADADDAARTKALEAVRKSQQDAARRMPRERRTHTEPIIRQATLQMQRTDDGWRILLPADLMDSPSHD